MKIKSGVLFCGGCNPRFDRMKLYEKLVSIFSGEDAHQSNFPQIFFSYYDESKCYDFILLINGCEAECLLNSVLPYPMLLIKQGDPENARDKILLFTEKMMAEKSLMPS